jgi:hypothetical protein
MSLTRARRRRRTRRPRARQGPGHQGRTVGDHHFEASPLTSVTRNFEATRVQVRVDALRRGRDCLERVAGGRAGARVPYWRSSSNSL